MGHKLLHFGPFFQFLSIFNTSIVEPPPFLTAPVPGVNFDAALLYSQANFLNELV
jgi:hypothetical protein